MIVINQGRVNYNYKESDDSPVIYETVCSNYVKTFIINSNLIVCKKVDKTRASLYEILTYSIYIYNKSDSTVENIILSDCAGDNTKFIKNSVKIDGVRKCGVTPEHICIGNLPSHEKTIITFKSSVVSCCKNEKIINYAQVSYDYIYNIEEEPIRVIIMTNKVVTFISCLIFADISYNNTIFIRKEYYEKIKINDIKTNIEIIKCKLICGNNENSILVIWKTEYKVYYYRYIYGIGCKKCMEKKYEYNSEIICIPKEITYIDSKLINIKKEYCMYYTNKESDTIIVNNGLIIY